VSDEEPRLITEVPAHIRHQSAPPPVRREPAPRAPQEPGEGAGAAPAQPPVERTRVRAARPTDDHDGWTVIAGRGQPSALRQPTGVTVPAVRCPAGHFTAPEQPVCRSCGAPVPSGQEPLRVPRPPLGSLLLADGQRVLLDRGAVLGRRPAPIPGGEPWPHLVELPADLTHLSRRHLLVELDGWHVVARDLGSSAGTTLRSPGRDPIRLRAHDPHVLEPGQSLDLAGDFPVTFVLATS
jgi:hypothetical protein